jgi:hypothetical protein
MEEDITLETLGCVLRRSKHSTFRPFLPPLPHLPLTIEPLHTDEGLRSQIPDSRGRFGLGTRPKCEKCLVLCRAGDGGLALFQEPG